MHIFVLALSPLLLLWLVQATFSIHRSAYRSSARLCPTLFARDGRLRRFVCL